VRGQHVGQDGAARLVFGLDDEPGIRRQGRRRFRYVDELNGRVVDDADTLARIRSLAVPPAWTDVWIAIDPCGHVQATGRDARGRKQYRYHPAFRLQQEEAKFELLLPFGRALPNLRRIVDHDLQRRALSRERVIALVVRLLEDTLERVGNEEYARTNGSYGLTTLRDRHARSIGPRVQLRFTGKSGRKHLVAIDDPRLAKLVRRCQDLPGQVLFQYLDGEGNPKPIRSTDVNEYLRAATGLDSTARTFRTWAATLYAAAGLATLPPPRSKREGQQLMTGLVRTVARELRNTPAVCRRSYVHPAVVDHYLAGSLPEIWRRCPARGSSLLTPDERRLIALLAS
jgi:DNA topoisomerase-1